MDNISWEKIAQLIKELADKIKASGFEPDYLIGITVGGFVPLALLAKELDINRVLTASASSYDDAKKRGKLNIMHIPKVDLSDKKVLLVDEIVDSGETLRHISKAIIHDCKISKLKTATLAISKGCNFKPDFYVLETDRWLVFPWERKD